MAWPTPQEYNEAVQNPHSAFADSDLRTGQVELNQLGLPRPISGNFACVYKIQTTGQRWAARCFISEVSDQQRRYEDISAYLTKVGLAYMVQFTYIPTGIKVQGRAYPLLKMQWVQGESLSAFVGRSIGYPDTLLSLAKVWARMMADLKEANIAHGDLQHGNVLVVGDQLRLIDYDGMFVPALAGKQSNECGHRNYQLPSRTGWDYGPYLDNFSAWVIYVSLVALAVHPELWNKYRGGDECLIFRKEDFLQPENSALLQDLNSSGNLQLRFLVELFSSLFNLSPQDVPSLDGTITKINIDAQSRSNTSQPIANWWTDHAETAGQRLESSVEAKRISEAESPTSDPGWIVDSLAEDKRVTPLEFKGEIGEVRIMILGSLALICLTRLFIEIPASELCMVFACVFGLDVLFCFVRYKHDPSQNEFESFKKESKAFIRHIGEHQAIMDAIAAEKLLVQTKLTERERVIVEEHNRLAVGLQEELDSVQHELNSQLQALNQARKDNASSETRKLNVEPGILGNQIADLNRKIAGLVQKETEEKNKKTNSLNEMHVQSYLRSCPVTSGFIPSVGEAYKSRLANYGFKTAADIDWRVTSVPGIGQARGRSLISWRQSLESIALRSAPGLTTSEKFDIESKYRQERTAFEVEKRRIEAQMNSQIASIRQYFAQARQGLNDEEQQLRADCEQKKVQIQKQHNANVVILCKDASTARSQAAPILNELSQKLQDTQKQIFALKWQSAKKTKEGRRFASLRFRNYLHSIISS